MQEKILKDHALTYLPPLLPLVPAVKSARQIVSLISQYSNPKETIAGLNEHLQKIEERSEGFTVSDDEDGESFVDGEHGIEWEALACELECVLQTYRASELHFARYRRHTD